MPKSKQPPVAILSHGPKSYASCRFRGAWLAEAAPELFDWYAGDEEPALADAKVVVFQKRHSHNDIVLAERAKSRGKKIVYDLTDPMWWFDPKSVGEMVKLADVVVVSSVGLMEAVRQNNGVKRCATIPDRMLPSFHPTVAQHGEREVVTLVWYGIAANRISLTGAVPLLTYAANTGRSFRLRIIDDLPTERLQAGGPFDVEHVAWTLETIHAQLTACDIALVPPYPGPWGDLRSNNKAVTAWWCGLPTTDGYDAAELASLIADADRRKKEGAANRERAELEYDIALSVRQWRALLGDLGVKV